MKTTICKINKYNYLAEVEIKIEKHPVYSATGWSIGKDERIGVQDKFLGHKLVAVYGESTVYSDILTSISDEKIIADQLIDKLIDQINKKIIDRAPKTSIYNHYVSQDDRPSCEDDFEALWANDFFALWGDYKLCEIVKAYKNGKRGTRTFEEPVLTQVSKKESSDIRKWYITVEKWEDDDHSACLPQVARYQHITGTFRKEKADDGYTWGIIVDLEGKLWDFPLTDGLGTIFYEVKEVGK
jgi:hypothetical protein